MNKLMNKIASLYKTDSFTCKYQIEFYACICSMLFMNLIGLILVSVPVVLLATLIYNTPVEQYAWNDDVFYLACICNFFCYGLSYGFFMHNKGKFASRLLIFGYSWMGLAAIVMAIQIAYQFVRFNLKLILNPQEHMPILYLDIAIFSVIAIIYLANNKSVKAFFDRILRPYQG